MGLQRQWQRQRLCPPASSPASPPACARLHARTHAHAGVGAHVPCLSLLLCAALLFGAAVALLPASAQDLRLQLRAVRLRRPQRLRLLPRALRLSAREPAGPQAGKPAMGPGGHKGKR